MKQLIPVVLLGLVLAAGGAQAQKPAGAQPSRMSQCNQDAGERKGDARKQFMSACLKTKSSAVAAAPAPAPASADKPLTAQQARMKQCNADAKGKKGDERKQFMSQCLRKK